jgi:hypothetical protein
MPGETASAEEGAEVATQRASSEETAAEEEVPADKSEDKQDTKI